jgi:hypothetical protein
MIPHHCSDSKERSPQIGRRFHWQGYQYLRDVEDRTLQIILNSSVFMIMWWFPLPGGCHSLCPQKF